MAHASSHDGRREFAHAIKPAPLACLTCRRKHLRCDGTMPICGRCQKSRADCQYTPSRRGYKTATRSSQSNASLTSPRGSSSNLSTPIQTAVTFSQPGTIALQGTASPTPVDGRSLTTLGQLPLPPSPLVGSDGQPPYNSSLVPLVDSFFMFFHESHPILPPSHLINRLAPIPPYLEAVLNFVGSHYVYHGASTDSYRELAASALAIDHQPSFFKVQALLIYSVVLHARDERPAALQAFDEAVELALKLGMNRKSFAENHGQDDLVREESMRRTWWALYMLDAMYAAFDQSPFKIDSIVVIDVPLPSEDLSYSTGVFVRGPPTLTEFRDRVFEDEEVEFSSFCYAIEAAHLLRRSLSVSPFEEQQVDQVESIEASINSWFHSLPDLKPHVLRHDGTIDEQLFLAYMLVHCAQIYLHLPRCNLLSTPAASASIACARRGPYLPPTASDAIHATKAIQAANGIANLAALSTAIGKHTPFFICGLVLSAVVQLSACSVRASKSLEPRRDRIALIIGNLKMLSRTWLISRHVMKHIKMVAREVLAIGIRPTEYLGTEDAGPDMTSLVSNEMWLGDIEIDGVT
ncbi:hypothetical protein AJ80_05862 [Polytolypa hystricis UAMH7299]|uniref:Zn(2)-C6 fungal-type domain-containing protein n=1 Tax=Polytolypa hystricis (strain UAMH7299) TaxID=1447883 RepID=A0A2B7Y0Z8_POLH7|nr:hypothetical protein AJ80_05862 [Polytolypa hystricis UAMH7299]